MWRWISHSTGMMERWNVGKINIYPLIVPLLCTHNSTIPLFQYSRFNRFDLLVFSSEENTDGGTVGDYASAVGRGVHSHR